MKTLRRILLLILCIAFLLTIIGFLLPQKVHIERKLVIKATPKKVFNQINALKNWENWAPWIELDPTMQLIYSGPESGLGATYRWQSNNPNVGEGSVSIISSLPYESVEVLMDFGENGKSTGKFHLEKHYKNTLVTWSIDSDLGMNPISRWFGLFSDRLIGPDLEKGLLQLDQFLDKTKPADSFEIIDFELPARVLISIRDTASPGTLPIKLSVMFGKISKFLKFKSLPPTGAPLAIFHSCSNRIFDIEVCLPVSSVVDVPIGLNCSNQAAQKTIMLKYFGPYQSISKAYTALQTYINDNDLKVTGVGWEEYISNPHIEADTNKWQTNIYYPVN